MNEVMTTLNDGIKYVNAGIYGIFFVGALCFIFIILIKQLLSLTKN